jgi:hypothetical protein
MSLISGIAHVNLTVPAGTLPLAQEFYGNTLGFKSVPVPALQRNTLAWYVQLSSAFSPPPISIPLTPQVRHHPRRPADPPLAPRQRPPRIPRLHQAPLLQAHVARSAARAAGAHMAALPGQERELAGRGGSAGEREFW